MKIKSIITWVGVVILLLFVLCIILIKTLVSPANVEATVVPRIEKFFDRDITVGSTELSMFPSPTVKMRNLEIANKPPFAGHSFGKIKSIDASLSIMPLLFGNLRINRIKVVEPMLGVQVNSAGNWNFDFLQQLKESSVAAETNKRSMLCNSLIIESGRFLFMNDSTGTRVALSGLSGTAQFGNGESSEIALGIELDSLLIWSTWGDFLIARDAASLNLEGTYSSVADSFIVKNCDWKLDKAHGRLEGSVGKITELPNLNLRLFSDHNDLLDFYDSKILEAFPVLKDVKLTGDLRGDISYKGLIADRSTANVRGKITVSDLSAKFPDANSDLKSKLLECNFNEQSLSIFTEDASIGPDPAQVRLAVENYRDPTISGEVKISCDAGFLTRFAEMNPQNQISGKVDLTLSGFIRPSQTEQARLFGMLELTNISFTDPSEDWYIDTLNLTCNFSGNDADISRFDVNRSGNRLQLSGKITDFTPYLATKGMYQKHPQFSFACTSDSFDFGSLCSKSSPNDTSHIQRALDYLCDFDLSGSLQVRKGLLLSVPFEELYSNITSINQIVHSDSTVFKALSGRFNADVVIDMSNITSPDYDIDLKVEEVHANDLLTQLTPLKDLLQGNVDLQASIKGQGTSLSQIIPTLTCSGKFVMDETKIGDLGASKTFNSAFGLDGIAQSDCDDFSGLFKISNRTLYFTPLTFKCGKANYLIDGGVGFDGNLDCHVTRSISKDEAKSLFALPAGESFFKTKSPAKALFHFTGNGDSPAIQLESIISKD